MLITPIQLVQFVIALGLVTYETLFPQACDSNQVAVYWMMFTYMVFLVFFVKLYLDKKQQRSESRAPRPVKDGKEKKKQ